MVMMFAAKTFKVVLAVVISCSVFLAFLAMMAGRLDVVGRGYSLQDFVPILVTVAIAWSGMYIGASLNKLLKKK
jgi:hypothetical protein